MPDSTMQEELLRAACRLSAAGAVDARGFAAGSGSAIRAHDTALRQFQDAVRTIPTYDLAELLTELADHRPSAYANDQQRRAKEAPFDAVCRACSRTRIEHPAGRIDGKHWFVPATAEPQREP